MSRNPPRKEPRRPAVAARSEHADLDPRVVVVDPTFAATLTTRHTRSFVVTLARSDAGVDEFTRAIPNVGEALLEHLDADGLATPGSPVRPGTILVGKRTPTPGEPSPEEKLLRAIFGEKAGDVRDSSLRVPPGELDEGEMTRVQITHGGHKTNRFSSGMKCINMFGKGRGGFKNDHLKKAKYKQQF